MAREQRSNRSARYVRGICQNTNMNDSGKPCPKCESKEIQQKRLSEEFVCSECGEPLVRVAEKQKSKLPMYAGIGALAIAVVIGIIAIVMSNASDKAEEPAPEVAAVDTVPAEDPAEIERARQQAIIDSLKNAAADADAAKLAAEEAQKAAEEVAKAAAAKKTSAPAAASSGTKNLGYAVFTGKLKNGQPNDTHGTMRYKQSHQIDPRDPKHRMAEAGDYVIGEWVDGKLVQGIWYDSSNTVKGSIMIGQ